MCKEIVGVLWPIPGALFFLLCECPAGRAQGRALMVFPSDTGHSKAQRHQERLHDSSKRFLYSIEHGLQSIEHVTGASLSHSVKLIWNKVDVSSKPELLRERWACFGFLRCVFQTKRENKAFAWEVSMFWLFHMCFSNQTWLCNRIHDDTDDDDGDDRLIGW